MFVVILAFVLLVFTFVVYLSVRDKLNYNWSLNQSKDIITKTQIQSLSELPLFNSNPQKNSKSKKYPLIDIVGCGGSGKSTLGKRLAKILQVPYIAGDKLYYHKNSNWTAKSEKHFRKDLEEILAKNTPKKRAPAPIDPQKQEKETVESPGARGFVLDGNYNKAKDIIWPRIDILIWLDMPFWIVVYRVFMRTFRRVIDKKPICNGNIETWRGALDFKKGMIARVCKVHWKYPKKIGDNLKEFPNVKLVRLRSPAECEKFVRDFEAMVSTLKKE